MAAASRSAWPAAAKAASGDAGRRQHQGARGPPPVPIPSRLPHETYYIHVRLSAPPREREKKQKKRGARSKSGRRYTLWKFYSPTCLRPPQWRFWEGGKGGGGFRVDSSVPYYHVIKSIVYKTGSGLGPQSVRKSSIIEVRVIDCIFGGGTCVALWREEFPHRRPLGYLARSLVLLLVIIHRG